MTDDVNGVINNKNYLQPIVVQIFMFAECLLLFNFIVSALIEVERICHFIKGKHTTTKCCCCAFCALVSNSVFWMAAVNVLDSNISA